MSWSKIIPYEGDNAGLIYIDLVNHLDEEILYKLQKTIV